MENEEIKPVEELAPETTPEEVAPTPEEVTSEETATPEVKAEESAVAETTEETVA